MVRRAPIFLLLTTLACASFDSTDLARAPLVDLTHPFDTTTIYWPTEEGFVLETEFAGLTERGYYYESHRFRGAEHGGTHIDAPIHFAEQGRTVDAIPLEQLLGPACVVDVSAAAVNDADYEVSAADLQRFEAEHGRLAQGSIVLLRTGFGERWPDRASYLGTDERGPEAVAKLHFPGLAPEAARWLVDERSISAIGIDTASIDHGPSTDFQSHRILFAANVPAFENVANLERLPPTGAFVIALPMNIAGGSGGPLRIVAMLPGAR
jgi:kynurenine formamidase